METAEGQAQRPTGSPEAVEDLVVIGGGIVGLATARTILSRRPDLKLLLLEKDDHLASQQSGHNSGVIHSGIYYRPGSLKASLCREGRARLLDYCQQRNIAHRLCGKLIVLTSEHEREGLDELERRAQANGLQGLRRLDRAAMLKLEPQVGGYEALHVPEAGVIDYRAVCASLAEDLRQMGGKIRTGQRVRRIELEERQLRLQVASGWVRTTHLLNCGGLHSDQIAEMAQARPDLRIVPFRGEYYRLRRPRSDLVRALIYPIPDPALPFLGVHLTRGISGDVDAGPNAVLATAREGYRRGDVDLGDLRSIFSYPGFWRLISRNLHHGLTELHRSLSKTRFVVDLQRLVPALRAEDLVVGSAGVRAQAVDRSGRLIDDFRFGRSPRALHVLNAPSPAATASLAIAERIADEARDRFGWP